MNRFRINQMMEVLLFPYCDPGLQKKDYLLKRYQAFRSYLCLNQHDVSVEEEKQIRSRKFRETDMELIHYLADRNHGRIKSYDDVIKLCDYYYPLLELERWMKDLQEEKGDRKNVSPEDDNIAVYYIHNLRRIAESLITYRDGIAAIRTWNNGVSELGEDIFFTSHVFNKVEVWNILSRFLVPDILIVIFAVDSGLDKSALYEQKPNISLADKVLVKYLKKGMAENHLHFNAGFDYEMVWIHSMHLQTWYQWGEEQLSKNRQETQLFQAALFRYLAAVYLRQPGEKMFFAEWLETYWGDGCADVIKGMYQGSCEFCCEENPLKQIWKQWDHILTMGEEDYLLTVVYDKYLELKTSSEFLLLFDCYRYVRARYWDTVFASLFLQYLRIKNNFFREAQMGFLLPGLRHFQEYFGRAKGKELHSAGKTSMMLDVFRAQAKLVGLKKLEIRIAPDDNQAVQDYFDYRNSCEIIKPYLYRQLSELLYSYRRYILECILGVRETRDYLYQEEQDCWKPGFSYRDLQKKVCRNHTGEIQRYLVPALGIVYHFLKRESLDDISGYCCWRTMYEERLKNSNHHMVVRQKMINTAKMIEEIRAEIPKLNEYIVGVDAASDENAMEPWMFSAAFNLMRSRTNTKPVITTREQESNRYGLIQNIGFTYHVGEDFRHILSGLRHIDEVIEEFHYKPGDRLGHAIALGIDVDKWITDNEILPVPLLEHLENLLWIWGKCAWERLEIPVRLEMLEEEILKYSEKIYQCPEGLSVRMLYKAYKMKFSLEHKAVLDAVMREKAGTDCKSDAPHCRYGGVDCNHYQRPWTEYRLLSTYYCPEFQARYSQVVLVPIDKADAEIYKTLQDILLKKVEKRGIYVETNPTSNLTIGDFEDLRNHPIFRMNSQSRKEEAHHVMVTVNSDDPAVFNTNVENELAYIYYAAEYNGYGKEDILMWLDKIRQNGMDASFVHKVKTAEVLLEETSGILDRLNNKI